MLALLMGVSLTACGRESVEAPGSEPENGVAAIEDDVISGMGIPTGRIVLNGWPRGFGADGGWVRDYAAWLKTILHKE